MTRRDDVDEVDNLMHQPRVIGKYNKRTPNFFKFQAQLSVRALEENQKKHREKHNLGLTTKLTNPLHTQKIVHIAGVNMKIPSENGIKNVLKKVSNRRRENRNKKRIHLSTRVKLKSASYLLYFNREWIYGH